MHGNDYFEFVGFNHTIDDTQQVFEYFFKVKKKLPYDCFIFEHFSNESAFYPVGSNPSTPCTKWEEGVYVHKTSQFLPAGQYDLWLGFLIHDSEDRLPINDSVDDRIFIGRFDIPELDIPKAHDKTQDIERVKQDIHSINFHVYFSEESQPVAWYNRGTNENRVAVISVPKAGTYLLGQLLRQIGFINCHLHLSLDHFEDYRNAKMENMHDVRYVMRCNTMAQLVDKGQFIPTHILHCLESKVALHRFRKLFIYRNLRDALVSSLKFELKLNQSPEYHDLKGIINIVEDYPADQRLEKYIELRGQDRLQDYQAVIGWLDEPDVLTISFEEIMGDCGKERQYSRIKSVATHVGSVITDDEISEILNSTIGAETLTYSGKRSNVDDYWNDRVERLFRDMGFYDLNKKLGYENALEPVK